MDREILSYSSGLHYHTSYIVVEETGLGDVSNPLFEDEHLYVGDTISFEPKCIWGIDNPIAAVICRDGHDIGEISPLGADVLFTLGISSGTSELVRGWRLALPEDAKALFSGVPIEDIYV